MENFSFLVFHSYNRRYDFLKKGGDSLTVRVTKNRVLEINIGIITAIGFYYIFQTLLHIKNCWVF